MILVDSTKYISWMRQGRNPVALLAAPLTASELLTCGTVKMRQRGVRPVDIHSGSPYLTRISLTVFVRPA